MLNIDKKVAAFGSPGLRPGQAPPKKRRLRENDGLLEAHDPLDQRLVTRDGRQLLREQLFEAGE